MNKLSFWAFIISFGVFLVWWNYPTKKAKSINSLPELNILSNCLSPLQGIIKLYSEKSLTFETVEATCPYPLLAYTTVVAESGWEHNKSELAIKVNNFTGMTVPRSRHYCCTLSDTTLIKKHLGLEFGKDYNVLTVNQIAQKNTKGEILVAYKNKWAIYLSPVHCALDLGEYQRLNITAEQASSPNKYLTRLMNLGYVSKYDSNLGYKNYWLNIYNKIESLHGKKTQKSKTSV